MIDIHTHALPLPLLNELAGRGYADLSDLRKEIVYIDPSLSGIAAAAPIPLPPEQYDVALRIHRMQGAGVGIQAVSAPPFVFGSVSTDPVLVEEITRLSNDCIAEFVAGSDGRLVGIGTIPVGLPGAVDEVARCMDVLGLAGLVMGTFGGGQELDATVNEPLWAELDRRQCLVLLHPSRASAPERLHDFHLLQLLGYPVETALAAARLIFAGVLDRYDPVLCISHGGGALMALRGRLELGWERKPVARNCELPPSEYVSRLYYDTAVFDETALKRLVADVSASQVLLGTDRPFDLADTDPRATVAQLDLRPDEMQAIIGGNARRLLHLDASSTPDGHQGSVHRSQLLTEGQA